MAKTPRTPAQQTVDAAGHVSPVWAVLAMSGIIFWFLIAFPFGLHNDAYAWVGRIESSDLMTFASTRFYGEADYRPLGTALAWIVYRAGNGSDLPMQLFNLAVALTSWWILCLASGAKRTFALCALVSGGVFFSGYLYLFHLHGVVYGPVLLWLALAIREYSLGLTPRSFWVLALCAAVASLFHPFTVVLALAFAAGAFFELGWFRHARVRGAALVSAAPVALFLIVLTPHDLFTGSRNGPLALLTSIRAVEVNHVVSLVALVFAGLTLLSTRWGSRKAAPFAWAVALVASLTLLKLGIPLAFLWITACLVKAVIHRRWILASTLTAAVALPFAGGAGSPTYAIYAFALGTVVTAMEWPTLEPLLAGARPALVALIALVVISLGELVHAGYHVPVLSRVATPVLAESERSHQLERMLAWFLGSPWRDHPVLLSVEAAPPIASGAALDRRFRPPTQQRALDTYLFDKRGVPARGAPPVILCFGGFPAHGRALYAVAGKYAGQAVAFVDDATGSAAGAPAPWSRDPSTRLGNAATIPR